ncbi:HDOD domain-containing protein [Desulfovibrionales bacterium]
MTHTQPSSALDLATSLRETLKAVFSPATTQLLQEAVSIEPNFKSIANIIKLDPALSATILALANSPFYGQSGKITNVQRAALILGNNELLRIALSLCLQRNLSAILDAHGFDAFANWRVIVWSAIGAELIAEAIAPEEKETAYLCALLKDLSLLMYAATFPEQLRPHMRQPDFVRTSQALTSWQDMFPQRHAELTADLLHSWHLPRPMLKTITAHHDIDRLFDYSPLTQAVILATRWAEVEFRDDPVPDSLAQLAFILGKIGALPHNGIEGLRSRCATRFHELCQAMNIREQPLEERLYSHSLQSIQDFHYQTKEVESISGGLQAVAQCIARHLRWNWNCQTSEIILFSLHSGQWERFLFDQEILTASSLIARITDQPVYLGATLPLRHHGEILGELRVPSLQGGNGNKAEPMLYTRLLSQCLHRRAQTVQILEIKAELLDMLPAGVALLTETGRIVRTNPRFETCLGKKAVEGQFFAQIMQRTLHASVTDGWTAFLQNPQQSNHCVISCDMGPNLQANVPCLSISSYKIGSGAQKNILMLIQDLTEIRILETEALRQRDFLHGLLGSMQDLVMAVDRTGMITYAAGKHATFLRGKNLFVITSPAVAYPLDWSMDAVAGSNQAIEVQLLLDDSPLLLELLFSRLPSGPDHALVVGRDISSIRRLEQKIKQQALLDALTQVFNRHHLLPILEREIARARRTDESLGMIFFDLDKFKKFNDTRGHHQGDIALRELGNILRRVLRKGMDFPCRFGGDEFVIISSATSHPGLMAMCKRIQQELYAIYAGEITLSFGASLLEDADTATTLLERCDQANYQAKSAGGNTIALLQSKADAASTESPC